MIVNELVTKFKFDVGAGFKNFNRQLQAEARHVDTTTKRMGRMFRALGKDIGSAMKHRLQVAGTKAVMRDLERIKGLASGMKNMFSGIGSLVAGAVGLGGITAAFTRMVNVGMEAETQLMKLTNIRGPQQARRDIQDLNQMAAQTPFVTSELVDSFQRLNAAGFKVDINAMRKLGDIAAGSGKSMEALTETMLSASRGQGAMVDNFNGMAASAKNGGLEMTALDSKTGRLEKTLIKSGDKAALLAFYLKAAERQDTAGSMERLSTTMAGLASTLSDNIDAAFRNFYNAGFGDALKSITRSAIDLAQNLAPVARNVGVIVGLKLKDWGKEIPEIFNKIKTAANLAGKALAVLALRAIGLRVIGLATFAYQAATAIASMGVAGWAASAGLTATAIAAAAIQIAIGAVVVAIAALAYDFYNFTQTGDSALLRFTENWGIVHTAIKTAYTLVVSFGMGLMDMGGVIRFWGAMAVEVWLSVGAGFSAMGSMIVSSWSATTGFLSAALNVTKQNGINTWNLIKMSAISAGNSIRSSVVNAIQSVINFLAQLPAKAASAFSGMVNAARNAAANMPVLGAAVRMLPGFATGGMVPQGYPNDSFVAGLTSGEVIVPPLAVRQIQQGNPAGFAKVAQLANAPMPSTPTYSMPAATVSASAGGMGGISINAPINQVFNMNTGNQSPVATARAVAATSTGGIRKELDLIARQTPQRIAAT